MKLRKFTGRATAIAAIAALLPTSDLEAAAAKSSPGAAASQSGLSPVSPPMYAGKNASGPFGSIERMDPGLDALIAPDAEMELLANGFQWSEGPTWLWREKAVVFSDVPQNTVYKWSAKHGLSVFLRPSGYTGTQLDFKEPGSNGLTVGPDGRLVLCQHGDRQISKLTAKGFEPLVKYYQYKKFNSPNDLTYDRLGNLYFTDPP